VPIPVGAKKYRPKGKYSQQAAQAILSEVTEKMERTGFGFGIAITRPEGASR
jgi:hypothetical protein